MTLNDTINQVIVNLDNSIKALTIAVQQLDQAAIKLERVYSKPKLVVNNEEKQNESI